VRRPERASAEELKKLELSVKQERGIRIIDRDITPERVWAMAEAMKRTQGLDLVVVDYDQLVIEAGMNPNSDDDNIFRHQRAFVSRRRNWRSAWTSAFCSCRNCGSFLPRC